MKYINKKIIYTSILIFLFHFNTIGIASTNNEKNIVNKFFENDKIQFDDRLINQNITIKGKLRKVKKDSIVLIGTVYSYDGKEIFNIKNKMAEIKIEKEEINKFNTFKRDEELIIAAKLSKSGILIMFFESGKLNNESL